MLIFLAQFWVTNGDFFAFLTKDLRVFIEKIHFRKTTVEWIYNILYFIFIWRFVDIDKQFPKQYKRIKKTSAFLMILAFVVQFIEFLFPNENYSIVDYVYTLVIIPLIVILSIISLKFLFKANNPVKKYAILGSVSLLIFSLVAFGIMFTDETLSRFSPIIFYAGVLAENIFFSLGLGNKQKLIIDNKNKIYKELENQLALNKKLKEQLKLKLESEIESKTRTISDLHKKSAEEKLKQIETKYEKELAELKIVSLRSQMNPHFIFNSLNSIKLYIIDNDAKKAIFYLNKFSKLIRKILEGARQHEVSLANELDTVKLYLTIENIRFNNEIDIQFDIDSSINIDTVKVPPLIMQPFLENAIWHGLSSKGKGKKLKVSLEGNDKFITIIIEDNGIGREKAQEIKAQKVHKNQSIGIDLTIERMERFIKDYESDYSLEITDVSDNDNTVSGTRVTLKIPKKLKGVT